MTPNTNLEDQPKDFNNWIPHRPETWTHRFANVNKEIVTGNGLKIDKGTRVQINMRSRFGDVGITCELTQCFGYQARVEPETDLMNWGNKP